LLVNHEATALPTTHISACDGLDLGRKGPFIGYPREGQFRIGAGEDAATQGTWGIPAGHAASALPAMIPMCRRNRGRVRNA